MSYFFTQQPPVRLSSHAGSAAQGSAFPWVVRVQLADTTYLTLTAPRAQTITRQIAHRARSHVAARRPRSVVPPAETRYAVEAFQHAIETGDLRLLLDILAPDVVLLGDGGGIVQAALAPVIGAGMVADVLARIPAMAALQPAQVNGYPALIVRLNGEINTVLAVRIDDGLITGLYAVRNPEKLSRVGQETAVSR